MQLTYDLLPAHVNNLLDLEGEKLLDFFLYLRDHLTLAVFSIITDQSKLDKLIQYYYCTYIKNYFSTLYGIDLSNCSAINFYELAIVFELDTAIEYCFDSLEKAYKAQTELENSSVFNIIKHTQV